MIYYNGPLHLLTTTHQRIRCNIESISQIKLLEVLQHNSDIVLIQAGVIRLLFCHITLLCHCRLHNLTCA